MSEDGVERGVGPSRRLVVSGGALFTALAASAGLGAYALAAEDRRKTVAMAPAAAPVSTPTPPPLPPPLGTPVEGVELRPAQTWRTQTLLLLPDTGEWFTTQAKAGTSGLVDPVGLAVGDIVVSRLGGDGAFLDSMVLPDSGHGMGLVVRMERGMRVVYSCWYAPDGSGRLFDVVRIPYSPGIAVRGAATTVVAGTGYPLDPSYDASADAVTVRHQGGGGPEYTRHSWQDFAAGDLSRPTGSIATPDSPPTHQGYCTIGDRFFFYTGAASDAADADPMLVTEYSWTTVAAVRAAIDVSRNSRLPDGTYPSGRMEPEGATIVVDSDGGPSLVLGVVDGGGPLATGPTLFKTFRYPFTTA